MNKHEVTVVLHNIRSAHNVGSILRTADGLGLKNVYLTGYSPYPRQKNDRRLPHIQEKVSAQLQKTALGAQNFLNWRYEQDISKVLKNLRDKGYLIASLEQTSKAKNLNDFRTTKAIALVVGNEIKGIDQQILNKSDLHLKIPMQGSKESFNVSIACALALYHLKFQ